MRSDLPLVSCIMPTANRRGFVAQAIAYFVRQDYPHKELVVVDDGADRIDDLLPDLPGLRYVRLPQRAPLGAKRNLACQASTGDVIAHWDDDDWMAPDRLSQQVAALLRTGADACGARDLLHYAVGAGEAWLYRAPLDDRPTVAGCTLLYRRSAWDARPFPDVDVGEDAAFVQHIAADRLCAESDPTWYVALLHAGNSAPKNLSDPCWQRRTLDEVERRLAGDRDFYVELRGGGRRQRPATVSGLTLAADFDVTTGYGSMAEYLCLGLTRAGATVRPLPLSLQPAGLSDEFTALLEPPRPLDPNAPTLYFAWPRGDLQQFRSVSDLFINTMWESSQLPPTWPAELNRARAVIVPTRFVARVCRDSGVHVPIEVIPEGIDPAVYSLVGRSPRRPLTTLIVGTFDDRKHVAEGLAAWQLAFADDPGARLIVKAQHNASNWTPGDRRIQYVTDPEPTRGIAHWYRQADVLLALGNEGFGLPLVEAMATGLPVIALDSEGQSDVCTDAVGRVLSVAPVSWKDYDNLLFGRCGVRGVPAVSDVADRLRWVATHRTEALAMGRSASDWALRHRNVWNKAPAVLDVVERHLRPPRPVRRTYQLWVSSWASACGIAEYTRHLVAAMPPATGLSVTSSPAPPKNARVLHVQHHTSLRERPPAARLGDVPLVVTEHLVSEGIPACEIDADALIALTPKGADVLRSRWPAKRVEMIPQGCPTWFPRRKRTRGRVIGSFGFLEPHKGFWQLLDVVRNGGADELLLFSHARSDELAARWSSAARGLRVRHVTEFLPSEDIAARLAAEADVLVFWYDDIDAATSSAAARVGLASGVPVLTSSTSWFEDLREVTYQPSDLHEGVAHLLEDTALRERLVSAARAHCDEHSWPRIAERHLALWRALAR